MYSIKIISNTGNIGIFKIGSDCQIEYTKEGSVESNKGVKALVYGQWDSEGVHEVFFDDRAYIIEQGRTVAVV